jgi:hypothetical protein
MKVEHVYDHHNGVAQWEARELQDWLTDVFEVPAIKVCAGCTFEIREHARKEFEKEGWALNVKIDQDLGLSIFAMKEGLACHLQTGNISRAAYDLLKLQYLYQSGRIEAAALVLPTRLAASELGSNIANAERITKELGLFDRVITVPVIVVAFR